MTETQLDSIDGTRIRVHTHFGDFEADVRDVVTFPEGLPGFEQCRRFVVLSSMTLAPVQCLHAVDGPPATFLVINPQLVWPRYRCVLGENDCRRLEVEEDTMLLWLALITVDEHGAASVNLRAPIVINPSRMIGYQVLPQTSVYPLRHPLDCS